LIGGTTINLFYERIKMALLNFNAATVEPATGQLDPFPSGWYKMAFTETSIEPTKEGNGEYIKLVLQVIEGVHQKRTVYENLNTKNSNPQTVEIAYKQLSAICYATGQIQLTDTDQLKNIPFWGKVKLEQAEKNPDGTEKYPAKNRMVAYKHLNDPSVPSNSGSPSQASAPVIAPPVQVAPPVQQWQAPPVQQPPVQQPPVQNTASAPPSWQPPGQSAPAQPPQPVQQAQPPQQTWTPPAGGQPWDANSQQYASQFQQQNQAPQVQAPPVQQPPVQQPPVQQAAQGAPAVPPWQQAPQ
jgi:hypothetical protein